MDITTLYNNFCQSFWSKTDDVIYYTVWGLNDAYNGLTGRQGDRTLTKVCEFFHRHQTKLYLASACTAYLLGSTLFFVASVITIYALSHVPARRERVALAIALNHRPHHHHVIQHGIIVRR